MSRHWSDYSLTDEEREQLRTIARDLPQLSNEALEEARKFVAEVSEARLQRRLQERKARRRASE